MIIELKDIKYKFISKVFIKTLCKYYKEYK